MSGHTQGLLAHAVQFLVGRLQLPLAVQHAGPGVAQGQVVRRGGQTLLHQGRGLLVFSLAQHVVQLAGGLGRPGQLLDQGGGRGAERVGGGFVSLEPGPGLVAGHLVRPGGDLPVDLADITIYYVGPTPAAPGAVIGSAGPTSSYRMDSYSPLLISRGQTGMIGKGPRGPDVREAMSRHGAVYFAAVGGAAALIAKSITSYEIVAYEDLGPEALARITVEGFPCIVAQDSAGGDLYKR